MTSDLPPPGPEAVPSDDKAPTGRRRRPHPNYTARRVAVGSAALAVVAVVAVAALVLGGSDDDDSVAIEPGWDVLVDVTRSSGEVVVLDDDGEEIDRFDGLGRVSDVHVRESHIALVGTDRVVLRGLDDDDDDEPTTVDIDRASAVVRHLSNRSFTLLVTPDVGGEIVVIDAIDGTVTEIGARAGQSSPLLLAETLRADPDADRFAVGDGRNFQTIVVDVDPDAEPAFFPGVPMALDDDLVVTSTNVGSTAELGIFDGDGERQALVPSERPITGVLDDGRFVYVTEEGLLLAVAAGTDEPTELADLDVRGITRVTPTLDGRRFVVTGAQQVVVADLDGDIVHEGELGEDAELAMADLQPWTTWRCLPVVGEYEGDEDDGGEIVDLDSGEVVAEIPPGEIESITTDGCGVHVRTATANVIATRTGTYDAGESVRSIVLAPDGTAAVVVAGGTTELVSLDDSRRLDLGSGRGLLEFARR